MSNPNPSISLSTCTEEILGEIISHPVSTDFLSLQSYALVSRFFHSIASRQLFSTIHIHCSNTHLDHSFRKFRRFHNVLKNSPEQHAKNLPSAVKVFKIDAMPAPVYNISWTLSPNWVHQATDEIAWVLSILPNLQSLSICQYGDTPPLARADNRIKQIEHTIIHGSLTSLELRGLPTRIKSLIYCSPSLEHISIGFAPNPHTQLSKSNLFLEDPEPRIPQRFSISKLKSLTFTRYGRELQELIKMFDRYPSAVLSLSELVRDIVITRVASQDDLAALEILLWKVSKGPIESLNIQLDWEDELSSVLTPNALSHIKRITLRSRLPLNFTPIIKTILHTSITQKIELKLWLNNPRKAVPNDLIDALQIELLKLTERILTIEDICIRVHVSTGGPRRCGSCLYEEAFVMEREIVDKFRLLDGHPLVNFGCEHSP